METQMLRLGFKPAAPEWKAQTDPLSYIVALCFEMNAWIAVMTRQN